MKQIIRVLRVFPCDSALLQYRNCQTLPASPAEPGDPQTEWDGTYFRAQPRMLYY
jgi:hypothetical protein